MKMYFRFLLAGLILGLFTEFELKLVAGVRPQTFVITLFFYPVLVSLAYAASRLLDRALSSTWKGDVLHYMAAGFGGLAVEWTLLGNGPQSNAFQLGMFAMWTTFCFGPRVLTRDAPLMEKARRRFWIAFGVVAVLLTLVVLLAPAHNVKIVLAVVALSGTYMLWSSWLLILGWRTRSPRLSW